MNDTKVYLPDPFRSHLRHALAMSDDPDIQVGALVYVGGEYVSWGSNHRSGALGAPRTHAEAHAIAAAQQGGHQTEGGHMVVSWSPCLACAQSIIAAGITDLTLERFEFSHPKWGHAFVAAHAALVAAGVRLDYYDVHGLDDGRGR